MGATSHFIDGRWIPGSGPRLLSRDPGAGQTVWDGRSATDQEVDLAVMAARTASPKWARTSAADRIRCVERFADLVKARRNELAETISQETGKPRWESLTEVDAMVAKAPVSIEVYNDRRRSAPREIAGATATTRFKPFGVLAVLGPFNLPGHLPNGHIIPALLAGNTIVFKPSERTPRVGQRTMELWAAAELPEGTINLVQGARETGAALAAHPGLDGLLFTGSAAGGVALNHAFAGQPGKILALEMGGNNPLVVWDVADTEAAAYQTIQSAFITSGQRCSCARRLIVPEGPGGDAFIERTVAMTQKIRVGHYAESPEPFMGPVISNEAAETLLAAQAQLRSRGARSLLEMKRLPPSPAMLSPGLVDVTGLKNLPDTELFGPLLQIIRVPDFNRAIREANNTAYGLSAGLFSDDRSLWERFYLEVRAGVVNWNRPLTGASSSLPFGGMGLSGNNRPSGSWAADYCSFPVASLESPRLSMPAKLLPGISP